MPFGADMDVPKVGVARGRFPVTQVIVWKPRQTSDLMERPALLTDLTLPQSPQALPPLQSEHTAYLSRLSGIMGHSLMSWSLR